MNFQDFSRFLSEIPNDKKPFECFFTLKSFAFWINSQVDVEIKIKCINIQYYSIECKIPFFNLWIEIYKSTSKELLYEQIFKKGLNRITEIYKEYDVMFQIKQNIALTIDEKENKFNTSIFDYENNSSRIINVWTYMKIKTEVQSRVGKDNLILSEKFSKHYILIGGEIIKDEYLEKLLPIEEVISEKDYGYIPSSNESIEETVQFNKTLTDEIINKYDHLQHYKFLIESGFRPVKAKDNLIYKQLISNTESNT